jgi:hypothetical protein
MGLIKDLISRLSQWGYDNDGDLTLKVAFIYFTMYKWGDPVVRFKCDFIATGDSHTKALWRKAALDEDQLEALKLERAEILQSLQAQPRGVVK